MTKLIKLKITLKSTPEKFPYEKNMYGPMLDFNFISSQFQCLTETKGEIQDRYSTQIQSHNIFKSYIL